MQDDEGGEEEAGKGDEDDLNIDGDDLELRLARLQYLLDRRAELLCSVRLRQNPHNVHEWHKRVKIFQEQDASDKVIKAYAEAVQTVDPIKADGKPHSLWVAFARYYEDNEDCDSARDILERATKVEFRSVEDLANVWCEWVEMELRHDEFQKASPRPTLCLFFGVYCAANVCMVRAVLVRVYAACCVWCVPCWCTADL
jgi:pre-mRNA-splicing factor SYF1